MAEEERQARISKASSVAQQVKISLEVFSQEREQALVNLMRTWPTYEPNPVDWFNAQAVSLMGMQRGFSSLVYADQNGIVKWVVSPEFGVETRLDNSLVGQHLNVTGLRLLADAETFSHALIQSNHNGHNYVAVGRAISPQEPEHGFIVASFDINTILTVMLGELVGPQFTFEIIDSDQVLFASGDFIDDSSVVEPEVMSFVGRQWQLRMQSQITGFNAGFVVTLVGILMSVVVTWFFHKQLIGAFKLSMSQQRYKTASDAALDAIMIYQPKAGDFTLVEANTYAIRMFAGDIRKICHDPLSKQLVTLGQGELFSAVSQVSETGRPLEHYVQIRTRLITPEWMKIQVVKAGDNLAITVRDVSERFKAQRELQKSEEKYRRLVDGMNRHFVYTKTKSHDFIYVSAGVKPILGYAPEEFCQVEKNVLHQIPDATFSIRREIKVGRKPEPYLMHYMGKDGDIKVIEYADTPVLDSDGSLIAVEGIARDVTKELELQEEVAYQANHDQLTGLMNRYAFDNQLKSLISRVDKGEESAVMCFVDMDRFKLVNDSCGHPAGDRLLKEIALLFSTHVAEKDMLARIGGDEFCMIFRNQTLDDVTRKLDTLLHDISNYRFVFEDNIFFVGASIGVIEVNTHNHTAAEMIKAADNACYQAKYLGRNRYYIYQPTQEQQELDVAESQTLSTLHLAIQGDGFELYGQPIVPLHGRDEGLNYEILLRLKEANNQLVSPGLFIPLAERHGLMNKIDWWVVDNTLAFLESVPLHVESLAKVAINLSGITLGDEALLRKIVQRVQASLVPAEKLCFEITETTAVTNLTAAQGFITTLRDLGCRFALDDFGAGMSSFTYLKHLDVDYVKIDGSFVRNMARDPIDHATVKAINSIAHSMGKQTIAEFVTDMETSDALKALRVDYGQGFALGKPVPVEGMLSYNT